MKRSIHSVFPVILCFLLCLSLGSCKKAPEPITKTSFKLNTVVTITIYDSSDVSLLEHSMELCDYYEDLFSRTRETSEIYQINQGLKNNPEDARIQAALPLIDAGKVHIQDHTISMDEGMILDLGAVSKGYIADRIKEYLVEEGVKSALIDLGGNVLCIGNRPDGTPFQIGIRQPFADTVSAVTALSVTDQSVVTSGIYERCFTKDGILYHHLLDPDTGYPCENELASVTIISDHSVDGDALSTCCFLMGTQKGMELINSLKDVRAVFLTREGELLYSEGF